jgi:hypothetical protein
MKNYNEFNKGYNDLKKDTNNLRRDFDNYKSVRSQFTELKKMRLKTGKDLTISLKTNEATGEKSISIAQSISVLKDDKPMTLYLKNALTLDKEQAKEIALILLKNC